MKDYTWPEIPAPIAPVIPTERALHNDSVTDNYYWMIDYFRKGPQSEQVIAYLEQENQYLESMMSGTRKFQQELYTELKGRIQEKDESVPVLRNGYFYYSRTEEGKQYSRFCRKKDTREAPEELLLDIDQMAEGHPYYAVTGLSISPDNRLLAYGVDEISRRQYTIYIKDLESGKLLRDTIPNTEGNAVWAADNKTLFYTAKNPETLLSEKIQKHQLGSEASADQVVYQEQDKSNYIGVEKSKSGKYILIHSQATLSSEVRFIPADEPDVPFQVFQRREKDILYSVTPLTDRFLILTNWEAENFRVMECPLDHTGKAHWKEVLGHRADVLIEEIEEFRDFIVICERKDGLARLLVRQNSGAHHHIRFADPAYTVLTGSNPEFNSSTLRYIYTAMNTPVTTYDYDMENRSRKVMKQQVVVGGYQAENYVTERLYAPAQDGTLIPLSIVYKKGLARNGKAPLLLYGYGSYGNTIDAAFSIHNLSLLNRGFVYAIAHIRGGQEMGRKWYEDGKLMKKMNTFTDFIACGEFLIDQQYTSNAHLYAQGGSAGGLLVGAVANIAPGLFHGLIAQVPFVDVVNTMLDESIPLTTNEFDEWGNPKSAEAYHYMKSYSPYENVRAADYPHMLVTTGLHDSQVQYFEPAKWVAKLRATKTDHHLLLLKTDMDFGHGGASGRFDYLKDIALNYAFLCSLEGISK